MTACGEERNKHILCWCYHFERKIGKERIGHRDYLILRVSYSLYRFRSTIAFVIKSTSVFKSTVYFHHSNIVLDFTFCLGIGINLNIEPTWIAIEIHCSYSCPSIAPLTPLATPPMKILMMSKYWNEIQKSLLEKRVKEGANCNSSFYSSSEKLKVSWIQKSTRRKGSDFKEEYFCVQWLPLQKTSSL